MPGGIRVSLDGDERVVAKLAAIEGLVRAQALPATRRSVDAVRNRAVAGIANGPKTGRVYTQRVATGPNGGIFFYGSRPPHQASAPGEYPAADTGNLMRSIWAEVEDGLASLPRFDEGGGFSLNEAIDAGGRIQGTVGADADYAAPLEYKPEELGGRPFLRKALGESADEIHGFFIAALQGKLA